jgi:hypothetical protein
LHRFAAKQEVNASRFQPKAADLKGLAAFFMREWHEDLLDQTGTFPLKTGLTMMFYGY